MNNKSPFNEEFYASIKLISGEELFAKICAFDEEEGVLIILDHPITVEFIQVPKLSTPLVKVNPWLHLTDQTTFIISLDKVMVMTEIHDDVYISMHKRYVRDRTKKDNKATLTPSMGYVSSVLEARKKLEETFKLESPKQTFE